MNIMRKTVHASSVAINDRAVVILGKSGSGKSSLALQLMAFGATLIADDQTRITACENGLWADKPNALPNKIEARGVGLLPVDIATAKPIALLVDLDNASKDRHPDEETKEILEQKITVWRNVPEPHFPAAIFVYISSMPKDVQS